MSDQIIPLADKSHTPELMAANTNWKELESAIIIGVNTDGNVMIKSSYISPYELTMFLVQFQAFVTDTCVRGQWEHGK